MITLKSVTKIPGIAVGLLVMGPLICGVPGSADEAPISAPGTAQDLADIQSRNASKWPWAMGGENVNLPEDVQEDYHLRQSDNFFDAIETDTPSQQWQNQNLGESPRESGKVPVVEF